MMDVSDSVAITIDDAATTSPRSRRLASLARLALPLALFLVATVLFALDLGLVGDDYLAYMRDPVTGHIDQYFPNAKYYFHKPFSEDGVFWRPIFLPYILGLTNALWNHLWIQNLYDAFVHLAVTGVLYVLLRALRLSRPASLVAITAFLVYPAPMQTVFWKASSGTTLAVGLMLVSFLAALSLARHPRRWWLVPALAGLGFIVPGLNEQPAPALAAMPLFFLAALPRGTPWKAYRVRLIAATAAVGLVCALYAYMLMKSGYGVFQPVKADQAPAQVAHMLGDLVLSLRMYEYAGAAFSAGMAILVAGGALSLLGLGAIAAAAGPWLARLCADAVEPQDPDHQPRRGLILLAASAALVMSLIPVIVIEMYTYWQSRYLYAPSAALAIIAAVALDALIRGWVRLPARARALARPLWQTALMAALLGAVIITIGTTEPFRQRSNKDAAELKALHTLVPDPPHNAFFMPMLIEEAPRPDAGHRWSVPMAYSTWSYVYSLHQNIPITYARKDVFSGYASMANPRVVAFDDNGICYAGVIPNGGPFTPCAGGQFVPWDKVIPFNVLPDGTLIVVTKLKMPDGTIRALPALAPLVERGSLPERIEPLTM